jgi:hypothetical protein
MPKSPSEVLADPNFQGLPEQERIKVMSTLDPKFASLPTSEQSSVLTKSATQKLKQPPATLGQRAIQFGLEATANLKRQADVGVGAVKQAASDTYGAFTGKAAGPIGVGLGYLGEKTGISQKVKAATEKNTTEQKIGGWATTAAEILAPMPGGATKAVKAGKEALEFRAIAASDPIPTIIQAIKPKASSIGFKDALTSVQGDIKAAEQELGITIGSDTSKPGQAVYDMLKAVQKAKSNVWGSIQKYIDVGQHMGARVDLTPLAAVRKASIPKFIEVETPRIAARSARESTRAYAGRSMTIPEAEELLESLNAKLTAYHGKYPTAQRATLASNPETAETYATAEKLRDLIYSKLNEVSGDAAVRGLKQQYGKLIEVEKGLWPRLNVAMGQAPTSLSEQIAKWEGASQAARGGVKVAAAALTGHPSLAWGAIEDFAGAYTKRRASEWLKDANKTDTLLRRAFANIKEWKPTTSTPSPFHPKALLERGPLFTEPPADTSAVSSAGLAPHQAVETMRRALPSGTAPFMQESGVAGGRAGGVVIPDILGGTRRPYNAGLLERPAPGQPPTNVLPRGPASVQGPSYMPSSAGRPIPQGAAGEELVAMIDPETGRKIYVPKWWLEYHRPPSVTRLRGGKAGQ